MYHNYNTETLKALAEESFSKSGIYWYHNLVAAKAEWNFKCARQPRRQKCCGDSPLLQLFRAIYLLLGTLKQMLNRHKSRALSKRANSRTKSRTSSARRKVCASANRRSCKGTVDEYTYRHNHADTDGPGTPVAHLYSRFITTLYQLIGNLGSGIGSASANRHLTNPLETIPVSPRASGSVEQLKEILDFDWRTLDILTSRVSSLPVDQAVLTLTTISKLQAIYIEARRIEASQGGWGR